jgi:hypothetical protein
MLVFVKQVPVHKNPEIEFFFQILGGHLGNFSVLTAVEVFTLLLSQVRELFLQCDLFLFHNLDQLLRRLAVVLGIRISVDNSISEF